MSECYFGSLYVLSWSDQGKIVETQKAIVMSGVIIKVLKERESFEYLG